MTVLEPVIQVRELPPALARLRQHLPSLGDLVTNEPAAEESEIVAYLAQGVVCGMYNDCGLLFDALQPGLRLDQLCQTLPGLSDYPFQPAAILTDGVWVWPGVLPYYVATYHLRLPARFLRHAADRGWAIDATTIDPTAVSWDAYDAVPALAASAAT